MNENEWNVSNFVCEQHEGNEIESFYDNIITTPSVLLFLSFILFWDVPKYCPVSKNKSH